MMSPRRGIIGLTMARDEWPLLSLAIQHAFRIGVDHIAVVDHKSNDQTRSGLASLQTIYGENLSIFRLETEEYLQQATILSLAKMVGAGSYLWAYVFDADEFLLLQEGQTLHSLLARVPDRFGAVRYELDQWVSPHDLDDSEAAGFFNITQKALTINPSVSGSILYEQLVNGYINFFDLPFPSKLIVRGTYADRLTPGSHHLDFEGGHHIEYSLPKHELRCGHLPMPSFSRLLRRVDHGKRLRDQGFDVGFGWQNQALATLADEEKLELFWTAHSAGSPKQKSSFFPQVRTVTDRALQHVFSNINATFNLNLRSSAPKEDLDWEMPSLERIVNFEEQILVSRLETRTKLDEVWTTNNQLHQQLEEIWTTNDQLHQQNSQLQQQNSQLHQKLEEIWTTKDQQLDLLSHELAVLRTDNSQLRSEIANLASSLMDIQHSLTVRLGRVARHPLRSIRRLVSRRTVTKLS